MANFMGQKEWCMVHRLYHLDDSANCSGNFSTAQRPTSVSYPDSFFTIV